MEKTFEEILDDYMAYQSMTETQKLFVKNMMQQVLEATISECHEIADKYYFQNSEKIIIDINNLPTDRIKTEK